MTIYRTRRGFLGSYAILLYVMWSQTPVEQHRLALTTMQMLPSTHGTVSASTISVFRGSIANPARLLSTLRTHRYQYARKTRSRLARYALAGRDFHPQDVTSFSQRTPRSVQKPNSDSRHLYAGGRLDSKQVASKLILDPT